MASEVIRKAKNTFYINYTFDGDNTINNTTGYTITLPPPALNIKANNAFLSITNLAFQNFNNDDTSNHDNKSNHNNNDKNNDHDNSNEHIII